MPPKASSILDNLSKNYELLKKQAAINAIAPETAKALIKLTHASLKFLVTQCTRLPLRSRVPEKDYFSFSQKGKPGKISRAVNKDLFDTEAVKKLEKAFSNNLTALPFGERERFLYTVAMSYCCACDLLKTGDQKTPATFFEYLIGHLFAKALGVNPRTQVEVLRLEEESSTLPTDFIFDLGTGKPKFHIPVKTSTRERVIQVFAHQRVLDGVHGFGKFTGILVCLTETKLDHNKREVVEICLPKQWILYQRFIAPMKRFYYFDIPKKYADLSLGDPPMAVVSFAKFFDEANDLMAGK